MTILGRLVDLLGVLADKTCLGKRGQLQDFEQLRICRNSVIYQLNTFHSSKGCFSVELLTAVVG